MGVMGYIGHLAYRVFESSLLFPFALSLIGILVIYLGVLYQRNSAAIDTFVRERLEGVRQMVPLRARASY
jgi:hypothetical protein